MSVKILVLSDSHGSRNLLKRICDMHRDADWIFYAGDGLSDLGYATSGMTAKCIRVCGNCDFFRKDVADSALVTVEGFCFFVTHGNMYGVKNSLDRLREETAKACADVAVFGHTHIPAEICIPLKKRKYMYLFNPGSVSEGSFGLISIKDGDILFSHGNVMGM